MNSKILSFLSFVVFAVASCTTEQATNTNESDSSESVDALKQIEFVENHHEQFKANHWDAFRFGIANKEPDFDMLKHYDPDQVSAFTANQLLEDEYTVEMLKTTSFDALEDAIFDGMSVKAFYVVVASSDIMVGTIYYFQTTSYGLQLVGSMPY
jgi:hypothetical protein